MSAENMVSQSDFDHLRKDVKEIKGALLGNEIYGQKGYLQRLQEVEDDVDNLKDFKKKIVYYTAGAAGAVTALVQFIINTI